jgi:hypothetical protein
VPHIYSPSQISSYKECKRKWVLKTLLKEPMPQGDGARLGDETHNQLKNYLAGGTIDYSKPSGYIAAAGFPYLPEPGSPELVLEKRFYFDYQGHKYMGQRDVFIPAAVPIVIDHKTTGNINAPYLLNDDTIKDDVQAIVYAKGADAPDVIVKWIYYHTKKPYKAKVAKALLNSEHIEKKMSEIGQVVEEMQGYVNQNGRVSLNVLDIEPPDRDVCDKYGGCPYMSICNIGPPKGLFDSSGTGFFNMGAMSLDDLLASLDDGAKKEVTNAGTPLESTTTFSADFINPPPQEPENVQQAIAQGVTHPITFPDPTDLDIGAKILEAFQPEEKTKRKRRTKAEIEADNAALTKPEPQPAPIESVENGGGFTLFIDCLPNQLYTDMSVHFATVKDRINQNQGCQDYRLIDYGKGSGLLETGVRGLIDEGFIRGNLYVSTQSRETHEVLALLVNRAYAVVRSVR